MATRILYEVGNFYVTTERFGKTDGYAVYENGAVAATRVASIGYPGDKGLKRAIAEADRRAKLDEDVAYKGYLIRTNPLNGMTWIEKDKQRISNAKDVDDAKRTIDMLTESFSIDVPLHLCEIGPAGRTRMSVQNFYDGQRKLGLSVRDAVRGTEFALNIRNVEVNSNGKTVVYFEE